MEGDNLIKNFDGFDLFLLFLGFGLMISLIILVFNFSNDKTEESCVKFYKENHYITNKCEEYRDKLENIDV